MMKSCIRALGAAATMVLCLSTGAHAATVTNLNDSGAGSLRAAIAGAAVGEVITFAPAAIGTILLATPLAVTQDVTIQGPAVGAGPVLDGQNATQVIQVTGGTLTLSNVTVANGLTAGLGGGIAVTAGGLSVSNTVFTGNSAANGGGILAAAGTAVNVATSTFTGNTATGVGGGAIIAFGTVSITRSTFVGNSAPINGGAINVQPGSIVSIVNDTFRANSSAGLGGAISILGTASISDSTFSANTAAAGAAIAAGGAYTLNNNIFADNAATGAPGALSPSPTAGNNNVFFNNTAAGVADDATGYGTAAFVVAAAQPIQPLGNYGGPTQTMPPVAGSAALCAGSVALLPPGTAVDQIGAPRIRLGGACLDAGAVALIVAAAAAGATPVPTLSPTMIALLASLLLLAGLAMRRFKAPGPRVP